MDTYEYSDKELAALLPRPAASAHKYSRGKLFVVAGCSKYPGAAALAAIAAQRMGAGYTEVVCSPDAVLIVRMASPSLVVRSWSGFGVEGLQQTQPQAPCAYVVGSGFDAADATCMQLVRIVLARAKAPVLVDGGGLLALTQSDVHEVLQERTRNGYPTVITPHGGEARHLADSVGLSADSGAALAGELARSLGVVSLLKGSDSFIADGRRTVVMREGTSALAKAGTGDVLAGMTGALLAQGLNPMDACVLAATLHARSGLRAAQELSDVCVCAEDVVRFLPYSIKNLLRDFTA